ncbi:MAG: helix-turn-helix transcriptional regulator [Pseudomonadota bacterium]
MFLIVDMYAYLSIMRNTMPSPTPTIASNVADTLSALGTQIRAHRKALRISATTVAEAAGMSRVTLHRIENGEPSVTMGAYLNALAALGMDFGIIISDMPETGRQVENRKGWIPARILLSDYPQLKQLAWQVQGTNALTPTEALSIYERNSRHMDMQALAPHERDLIEALQTGLSQRDTHV